MFGRWGRGKGEVWIRFLFFLRFPTFPDDSVFVVGSVRRVQNGLEIFDCDGERIDLILALIDG